MSAFDQSGHRLVAAASYLFGFHIRRVDHLAPFLCFGGKMHDNTIIEPDAIKGDEDKLNNYCFGHGETTVMNALKKMGLSK